MTNVKKITLTGRWFVVASIAIIAFWSIWTLVTGDPIPMLTVTRIPITPEYALELPFGLSYWWFVLTGIALSTVIISALDYRRLDIAGALQTAMIAGPLAALITGLVYVLLECCMCC